MKKIFLFFLLIISSIRCHSQISFEKGYFINTAGQKTECQIKNIDWRNNPTEFEFRLSENDETQKGVIHLVEEFGIYNTSKYIRKTLNIDRTGNNINFLSNDKNPIFKEEELFLRVLIEGKSNLYEYVDGNTRRYFYKIENSNIEQLVFKSYKKPDGNIGQNNRFRQQLWNDLHCPNWGMNTVQNVDYNRKDLTRIFLEHNKCAKSEIVTYGLKQKTDRFNLTLRPRFNMSSLAIENSAGGTRGTDFGDQLGFGFGLEAEFVLPFNKNKWAIVIEPTYQSFKSEKSVDVDNVVGGKRIANIDYTSIEFPLSVRHYFFLNQESRVFANFSYIFDSHLKSSIDFNRADGSNISSLEIETGHNLALGVGYKYHNKYSLELRYQTNRELLRSFSFSSNYRTISFIAGYTIF